MIKLANVIILLVVCAACYKFGHNAASLHYAQLYNEQLDATNKAYNARLEELNQVNDKLNQEIKRYESDNLSLTKRTNDLRVQLNAAFRKAPTCTVGKSVTSRELSDRRHGTLEAIVNGATDLILERDRIALSYNELKKQCQLK